jgi:hypothetical protein
MIWRRFVSGATMIASVADVCISQYGAHDFGRVDENVCGLLASFARCYKSEVGEEAHP